MDKFIQIGEKLGLEGEKLLEFVREQLKLEEEREENRQKIEEERRREEEEKEEKRRQLEEEKEEKRRRLEEEKGKNLDYLRKIGKEKTKKEKLSGKNANREN